MQGRGGAGARVCRRISVARRGSLAHLVACATRKASPTSVHPPHFLSARLSQAGPPTARDPLALACPHCHCSYVRFAPHAQLQQWRLPRTSPSPLTPLFNAVRARFRLLSFPSKLTTHHLKGRQQQKREALANEILGSGRRKSAPGAAAQNNSSNNRKGAAGGSLASRMGVTKVR